MSVTPDSKLSAPSFPSTPFEWGRAAWEYSVDAWQRSVLYSDVQRQRGDQYREHVAQDVPTVLNFPSEAVFDGLNLERPVNYWLVRITPRADQPTDPRKRPFIVIDPRAGHGPGIGGFKPESEIGAVLNAGHPCYFVGFSPNPQPSQTVEDVLRAEAEFVKKVGELHPESVGKPAVIGNCQAGWQILMTASLWPELFGPIIVAGAPLSYWAGDNPMRYTGGLLGGSWLTAFTSDLGNGHFDGAWLVQNFESLNPANTWWGKSHHLYANVDTEAPRYLEFEKYWGGYVNLNDVEIQYIVDNLFIGNKLSTAQLRCSDGRAIDLRNISSPIVVFSSFGDNITPPAQALGWITDLYESNTEVIENDQTIVYATHESIGHLGIFVSSKVGSKEHVEFANNIELINLLPAGVYQASVQDLAENERDYIHDPYRLAISGRKLDDIRAIVNNDPASDARFARAAQLSEQNLEHYQNLLQPWVKALSSPQSAQLLQATHPLRVSYEWWSSANPLAKLVQTTADQVRESREVVDENNPFWQWQQHFSSTITRSLNHFRDNRDQFYEDYFNLLYGVALSHNDNTATHTKRIPEDLQQPRQEQREQIYKTMTEGGLLEASVRSVFYVLQSRGSADERHFDQAKQLHECPECDAEVGKSFRTVVREQAKILNTDVAQAINSIEQLLLQEGSPNEIRLLAKRVLAVATAGVQISGAELERLNQILEIFERAAQQSQRADRPDGICALDVNEVNRKIETVLPPDLDSRNLSSTRSSPPSGNTASTRKTVAAKKTVAKKATAPQNAAKKAASKQAISKTASKKTAAKKATAKRTPATRATKKTSTNPDSGNEAL